MTGMIGRLALALAPNVRTRSTPPLRRDEARPERLRRLLGASPGLDRRCCESLVVFLPIFILPSIGTAADLALVAWLYAAMLLIEAMLALPAGASPRTAPSAGEGYTRILLVGGCLLTVAPVGIGALCNLALYTGIRAIATATGERRAIRTVLLDALATAVLLDLPLVALGLERSWLLLALGAAIGGGLAALRLLERDAAGMAQEAGADSRRARRATLETLLATTLVLALALYGALLAHEPALAHFAVAGAYLTVPLLALLVLRLGAVGFERRCRTGPDGPAILLLATWAVSASWLLEG
jgi:hypothetical protein